MSYLKLTDEAAAVATALAGLDVRPGDRVLIMLPDGPGFADSFVGAMQRGALPLPANPLLPAGHICAVAAAAQARFVLALADRIPVLAAVNAESAALVDGPQGTWAIILRLR